MSKAANLSLRVFVFAVLWPGAQLAFAQAVGAPTDHTKATPAPQDAEKVQVEFLIGDRLVEEGGNWKSSDSVLRDPFGIDFDAKGAMYIVELESGRILRRSPDGTLQTLSEKKEKGYSGDGGSLEDARFNGPHNCVVTPRNQLLVADSWNHCVRRVDLTSLRIDTLAGTGAEGFSGDGGPARSADFNFVMCIALDPTGNRLHIADLKNLRIRDVDLASGRVRTVAGNGQKGVPRNGTLAVNSPLVDPRAVASDSSRNLYILERGGHSLRVAKPDGTIQTVVGTGIKGFRDGPALEAQLASPKHICCDRQGNVYIADDLNGAVRKYDPRANTLTTLVGRGIGDPTLQLLHPHGVRWYDGQLYVVDTGHHRILKLIHSQGD